MTDNFGVFLHSSRCWQIEKKPVTMRDENESLACILHIMLLDAASIDVVIINVLCISIFCVAAAAADATANAIHNFFFLLEELVYCAKQLVGVAYFLFSLIMSSSSWIFFRIPLFTSFLANHLARDLFSPFLNFRQKKTTT